MSAPESPAPDEALAEVLATAPDMQRAGALRIDVLAAARAILASDWLASYVVAHTKPAEDRLRAVETLHTNPHVCPTEPTGWTEFRGDETCPTLTYLRAALTDSPTEGEGVVYDGPSFGDYWPTETLIPLFCGWCHQPVPNPGNVPHECPTDGLTYPSPSGASMSSLSNPTEGEAVERPGFALVPCGEEHQFNSVVSVTCTLPAGHAGWHASGYLPMPYEWLGDEARVPAPSLTGDAGEER